MLYSERVGIRIVRMRPSKKMSNIENNPENPGEWHRYLKGKPIEELWALTTETGVRGHIARHLINEKSAAPTRRWAWISVAASVVSAICAATTVIRSCG